MPFKVLNVSNEIITALKELSYEKPTQIQEKSIPVIMQGKDLVGISKTGSGKTAAFGIPILEKIDPKGGLQVIILAPTRELAVQIAQELKKFGKYIKCRVATIYGGVSMQPQIKAMGNSQILVGTPGRTLDHLQRGNLDTSGINCFVLDEADKMVEMGFVEDITQILQATPKGRQIILFGATISTEINNIKKEFMKDPVEVKAEVHVKEDFLEQYYYDISHREKFSLLIHLLNKEKRKRTIIFCSSRSTVELLERNLKNQNVKVAMIHGKLSQHKRLKVIEMFNKHDDIILVASAVAARGLDIKNVSHVFNYDLSGDPQEYVHRVGRTARAGESGKAITLLSDRDYQAFNDILDRYKIKVKKLEPEHFDKLRFDARPGERRGSGRGGFSGGRSRDGHRSGSRDSHRSSSRPRSHGGDRGSRPSRSHGRGGSGGPVFGRRK